MRLLPDRRVTDLETYRASGGGRGLERAREIGPERVIGEIAASGLRGRGGAGFPTATKWRGTRDALGTHRYVVMNAAEGEPATFKDRALLRANPYQAVEGLAIAALAVGATEAYVGVKASFAPEREALLHAVSAMEDAGLLDDLSVTIVEGPEEYLFGEEKALLEVLEGGEPLPRMFPPYVHGLFATAPQMGWQASATERGHDHRHESNPTVVNNVETLANVPWIVSEGADWFRSVGTVESPGTLICTVVGDVARSGVFEVEMGTPLSAVLSLAGGVPSGRSLQAIFSGVANPVITPDLVDVRVSYEAMEAVGSGLGAAGFVVYDETACMVKVAATLSRFLYVESCGQCPACKFGTGEITAYLERIDAGRGEEEDLRLIEARLRTVTDANRCYLPVQEQRVVASILQAFPEAFVEHLERGECARPRAVEVLKLVDLEPGAARYDERQARKQPDWTYR